MIEFVRCWIKAEKNALNAATPKSMAAPPAEVGCSSLFPHLCMFFIVGDFLVWVAMDFVKGCYTDPETYHRSFGGGSWGARGYVLCISSWECVDILTYPSSCPGSRFSPGPAAGAILMLIVCFCSPMIQNFEQGGKTQNAYHHDLLARSAGISKARVVNISSAVKPFGLIHQNES